MIVIRCKIINVELGTSDCRLQQQRDTIGVDTKGWMTSNDEVETRHNQLGEVNIRSVTYLFL